MQFLTLAVESHLGQKLSSFCVYLTYFEVTYYFDKNVPWGAQLL